MLDAISPRCGNAVSRADRSPFKDPLREDENRVCARSAQPLRVSVDGSFTGPERIVFVEGSPSFHGHRARFRCARSWLPAAGGRCSWTVINFRTARPRTQRQGVAGGGVVGPSGWTWTLPGAGPGDGRRPRTGWATGGGRARGGGPPPTRPA